MKNPYKKQLDESILRPKLTPKEVAALAGFRSEVTALRAFRRGELPGFKFGPRAVRFDPADVAVWIARARVQPTKGKTAKPAAQTKEGQ